MPRTRPSLTPIPLWTCTLLVIVPRHAIRSSSEHLFLERGQIAYITNSSFILCSMLQPGKSYSMYYYKSGMSVQTCVQHRTMYTYCAHTHTHTRRRWDHIWFICQDETFAHTCEEDFYPLSAVCSGLKHLCYNKLVAMFRSTYYTRNNLKYRKQNHGCTRTIEFPFPPW